MFWASVKLNVGIVLTLGCPEGGHEVYFVPIGSSSNHFVFAAAFKAKAVARAIDDCLQGQGVLVSRQGEPFF